MVRINLLLIISACIVFAGVLSAKAQGGVRYEFLEVVDSANEPVADAVVDVRASCVGGESKTDGAGKMRFPIGAGDCSTDDFTITKPGYYPFRDLGLFRFRYENSFFNNQFRTYDQNVERKFRVELLRITGNASERKAARIEELKRELFWAIGARETEEVKRLLKAGVDPNTSTDDLRGIPGPYGIPAILMAARLGDITTIQVLLDAGVSLRKKEPPIRDLLLYYLSAQPYYYRQGIEEDQKAMIARFEDGVEILIKAGVNINATGESGETALMIASEKGYGRTVKMLLEKGLAVDRTDLLGRTALTVASSPEVIAVLLSKGAKPNRVVLDRKEYYDFCDFPLLRAVFARDTELIKLLVANKADMNLACSNGRTALQAAMKIKDDRYGQKNDEPFKVLVALGADLKHVDETGGTNLMYAVRAADVGTVDYLLKAGVPVNAQNKQGETALMNAIHWARQESKVEIVKLLLKNGANPNITCVQTYPVTGANPFTDCNSPLIEAVSMIEMTDTWNGFNEIVDILVANGADPNLVCSNGDSVLFTIARKSNIRGLKKLIDVGADAKGEQGHRALAYARTMLPNKGWFGERFVEIARLLELAGAK